jgi:cation diffusion facilitator CzcD-associated flavoprotein CzcO
MPAHQPGGKNECATAAEEAARVALACGVFREGLTPKFTGGHAKHGRPCATTS